MPQDLLSESIVNEEVVMGEELVMEEVVMDPGMDYTQGIQLVDR